MSSVSMSGGCSAALFSGSQPVRAADSNRSQKLFDKLDINGDGAIDASELKSFVSDISSKTGTPAIDADSLLTSLDSDGNGSISSTELKDNGRKLFDQLREQLMGSRLQSPPQPSDPDQLFGQIDTNGDGSISADEFRTAMQNGPGGSAPASQDGGIGKLLMSLIEQYRSSGATDAATSSTLSVAA